MSWLRVSLHRDLCGTTPGVEGRVDQKFDLELRSAAGGAVRPCQPRFSVPGVARRNDT